MRTVLLLIFLIQFGYCNSQSTVEGKYRDHFGYSIELMKGKTFEFNFQFDLASGWAIGTWNRKGDTIYLTVTPVLDTLERTSRSDSLVLSSNMTPERISEEQFAISSITSGGQLPDYVPKRLLFKKERLYTFDKNGRIKKGKVKGMLTKKKFDPWYFRIE